MISKKNTGLGLMAALMSLVLPHAPAVAHPPATQSMIGENQSLIVQIRLGAGCSTWRGTCRLNITGPKPVGIRCFCRNSSTGTKTWGKVVR